MARIGGIVAALFAIALLAAPAGAQSVTLDLGGEDAPLTARLIQLAVLMTVLSLAPSIVMMTTSFVRIIVVLSILRTAMGLQQSPPNTVLISLALFMTAFIMAPVFGQAYERGLEPLSNGEITLEEAYGETTAPFKAFMLANTREEDLALFFDLAGEAPPTAAEDAPLRIIAPAFMISELRRAFEIGFLLFIPFLVIDLVVASILMAMGMMMLPPVIISLPFKLIFFVLVDGWRMIVGSLVASFNGVGLSP